MCDVRTAKERFVDAMQVAVVALGAFWVLSVWPFPTLHPDAWEPVACAVGLRPPEDPFSGLYRFVLALVVRVLPPAWLMGVLPLLAHALVAAATGFVYMVVRDVGARAFTDESESAARFRSVWRLAAMAPAVVFLCMDPVWRAGLSPTPTTVLLPLVAGTALLFVRFALYGSLGALYASAFLAGVASGEHLVGLVPFLAEMVFLRIRSGAFEGDEAEGVDGWRHAWGLIVVWMVGLAIEVALAAGVFRTCGGVVPDGGNGWLGLLDFVGREVWTRVAGAATPVGWAMGGLGCVALCAFAVTMYMRARWEDGFTVRLCGFTYKLLGVLALAQIAGISPLWFVRGANPSALVPSETLRAFFFALAFTAFALVFAAFVAQTVYGGSRWQFVSAVIVLLVLPVLVLPIRRQQRERAMLALMGDYADEVLDETRGRETIFTDGAFDALVELKAWRCGRRLVALSMMAPNTDRERAVRLRAAENDEDVELLQNDASAALRTWVKFDSPRLPRVAAQLGFEFWRGQGRSEPSYSGVAALPGDPSEETVRRGRAAADALAARALEIGLGERPFATGDRALRRLWPFLLWRLSRLQRMRSDADSAAGRAEDAARAGKTAERLDAANADFVQLNLGSNWLKRARTGALTPREGLAVGLARADFEYASAFAEKVLSADPDDARAHFALGMRDLLQGNYADAERHLLKSLARNPDEPAALNNLANAQFGLGKLAEAEENARRALRRLPNSESVRRTLERIRKKMENSVPHEKMMP